MSDLVEMTHPTLPGRSIKVGEQTVPHRERAGWVRVAEGAVAEVAESIVDLVHHDRTTEDLAGDGEHDAGTPVSVDDTEAGTEPAASDSEGGVSL